MRKDMVEIYMDFEFEESGIGRYNKHMEPYVKPEHRIMKSRRVKVGKIINVYVHEVDRGDDQVYVFMDYIHKPRIIDVIKPGDELRLASHLEKLGLKRRKK